MSSDSSLAEGFLGHIEGNLVLVVRNIPELDLHIILQLLQYGINDPPQLCIRNSVTTGLLPAILLPLWQPFRHALDDIVRVGLDDERVQRVSHLVVLGRVDLPVGIQDENASEGFQTSLELGSLRSVLVTVQLDGQVLLILAAEEDADRGARVVTGG